MEAALGTTEGLQWVLNITSLSAVGVALAFDQQTFDEC